MIRRNSKKLLRTWMVVMNPTYMTTMPAVLGCEKESWDPFFPFPLWGWTKVTSSFGGQGCEPATTAVLQAVGSREEGAAVGGGVHQRNWGWGEGSRRHPMFWSAGNFTLQWQIPYELWLF